MKRFSFVIIFIYLILGLIRPVIAQYYFGRNKIQYVQFDWHILKTEHFDIYFYPEMEELAEIGAAYAEESYRLLEDKFNHSVNRRIPLIFYSSHAHFQQTNTTPYFVPEGVGGFFEFLKGRVVVPANGSLYQFKRVMRHELIHVFTYSKEISLFKNHKQLNHPSLPLWFMEGIAEYWSMDWDSQGEMFIRDAVLNGYLVPLTNMYQIYGSFLMYKEGQIILKYISEKYGDEKILQLIDNFWMARTFSEVMKLTIGFDYKEFDKEWIYYLKKNKYPLLEDSDSPTMITTQITEHGINTKPAFIRIKDKPHVVFVSNRSGYSNIYIEPITNSNKEPKPEVLVKGERTSEFESFHLLRSKIDVNSKGDLVFASKSGERDVLYIYNIAERRITGQFDFDELVSIFSPAWSPSGSKVAFSGLDFSGKSDLYTFDLDSEELCKLTNDYFDDRDPDWSADGSTLVFSSDRSQYGEQGYYNIFTINLENSFIEYVTNGPYNDYAPVWSPDGKYLAFTSDRDGAFNIWMLKRKKSKQDGVRLALLDYAEESSLSPFRTSTVASPTAAQTFMSEDNENYEFKKLTNFTTGAFDPEWTDDGSLLFAVFENYSFQLRLLSGVLEKFVQQPQALPDYLGLRITPQPFARLSGKTSTSAAKYKLKYDLDVAQSQITQDPIFGTSGGMQLAISDMLGNYQYYFLLFNNARTRDEFLESFNVAMSRVDLSRRTNFALGAYHFAGRYYNFYDLWYWERRYGGYSAVSYPLSTFERVEGSLNIRYSDKEWFVGNRRRKALLISNFISFIKDNSLWGPSGPIDGERYNFTLGNTIDIQHTNVNFYTIIVDYRRYFRLSNRVTHAVRLMTMFNHGKESTPFFMGGSWDLRGYGFWRITGTKIALISNELRFPFIDRFIINFPFGGLGFSAIRGAAFLDLGNGWTDELYSIRGSTGFGIRFRFGGVLVLRFDVGRRFTMTNPNRFYDYRHIDVQKGWFKQFFFGWDF